MVVRFLSWFRHQGILRLLLCALLLLSLYLLTAATENSARFGRLYVWLLLFNALALVGLITLIGYNVLGLLRSVRHGRVGSRLTARIVGLLALLALVPGLIVYGFSMQFLRSGIDSWFDVRVEGALQDALELSRASLDLRMRDILKRTQGAADGLVGVSEGMLPLTLGDMRQRLEATELTLLGSNGHIIASSSTDTESILPHRPEEEVLLQLRQGRPYVALDPIESEGLHIRAVVAAPNQENPAETRLLQALYPISPRLNDLADQVEQAFQDYRELAYLREPLKDSFILTLSLVLLVSLLFALWSAFYLARRLVAPLSSLADGTRALAEGAYGTQLPPAGNDELGFLVHSFNDMSRRVAHARDDARRGQRLAESQRAYLETVLSRLSSGVLTLDRSGSLRTCNEAAVNILSAPLEAMIGHPLTALAEREAGIAAFVALITARHTEGAGEWREGVTVDTSEGRRVLMCSGAELPARADAGGQVVVFDDVTALIQAQRDSAWGEVARRLAHEIRNPLTPIQLSAERIQHKFHRRMEGRDAEVLSRATNTIINQVETLKAMVNAFSEYARPPALDIQPLDLNALVQEITELYRGDSDEPVFSLELDAELPSLRADAGRLRQLLNNLVHNALEATPDGEPCRVTISTRREQRSGAEWVALTVADSGPGFAPAMLDQLFEPYVTTKTKGTGLGLPIVKKIVEEHNGRISASNRRHGAQIVVRLPCLGQTRGARGDDLRAIGEGR